MATLPACIQSGQDFQEISCGVLHPVEKRVPSHLDFGLVVWPSALMFANDAPNDAAENRLELATQVALETS